MLAEVKQTVLFLPHFATVLLPPQSHFLLLLMALKVGGGGAFIGRAMQSGRLLQNTQTRIETEVLNRWSVGLIDVNVSDNLVWGRDSRNTH